MDDIQLHFDDLAADIRPLLGGLLRLATDVWTNTEIRNIPSQCIAIALPTDWSTHVTPCLYTKGLAVLTTLIVGTYLSSAFKSLLWWTVAIAMTPFFVILAILEALEDSFWPTMPKLFWKAVDFSTREVFKFYAGFFLLLAICVAPASSITKWVETTTKILAPFQVAKLYTWYREEAWDRLGDFWAVVTLSAVSTSVSTSLFMNAPHASVLSFLNWWIYGIVATLTVVEPALSLLGVFYASIRSGLPQVARYETVQSGAGWVKQEAVQNRLAWTPQIPFEVLKVVKQYVSDISRNQPAPAYEVSPFPTFHVEGPHTSTPPMDQYSRVETIKDLVLQEPVESVHQESVVSRGREEIRYTGPDRPYWRRGSGERVRPIDGDNAHAGIDNLFGHIEDDCLESNGADD